MCGCLGVRAVLEQQSNIVAINLSVWRVNLERRVADVCDSVDIGVELFEEVLHKTKA
jgi:hypothetical protein